MSDRLDALLSARLDDELTREERDELEGLLAERPENAARARVFDEVEARLQTVADHSAEHEGLAAIYDGLRERLGFEGPGEANEPSSGSSSPAEDLDGAGGMEPSHGEASLLGRLVVPLVLAAAAAILFYFVLPMNPPPTGEPTAIAGAGNSAGDKTIADGNTATATASRNVELEADLEDELVLVLGYGEEMSELTGITSDDLDVIEQLDLLDFLSTRIGVADEMEDRG